MYNLALLIYGIIVNEDVAKELRAIGITPADETNLEDFDVENNNSTWDGAKVNIRGTMFTIYWNEKDATLFMGELIGDSYESIEVEDVLKARDRYATTAGFVLHEDQTPSLYIVMQG